VEGPSEDPTVEAIRNLQVKNFLTVTMLSLGLPMILMGDEMRRTQRGNNNAWCQDNEVSWLDWDLLPKHSDVYRFARLLNQHRLMRIEEAAESRVSLNELLQRGSRAWHGVRLWAPDWSQNSHSLAMHMSCPADDLTFYLILNSYREPLEFELPILRDGAQQWRRWIDTSLKSPDDIVEWPVAPKISIPAYMAAARSVAVLYARLG
jgi:glycogen operon protein